MLKNLPFYIPGLPAILLTVLVIFNVPCAHAQSGSWSTMVTVNSPTARHECSFAQTGDKFYLLGGRGLKPVEAYDPATNSWTSLGFTPQEIHHFQATELHGLIYLVCAFEGNFPAETGIPFLYIYDPLYDTWFVGPDIPAARIRGSAGVVLKDDKFYIVGGLTDGHRSGWVKWFDEYNPATNEWTILPDAPRARDHFAAALAGDLLVCAGGRRSGAGTGFLGTFDSVVLKTDIYDFSSGAWTTLPSPGGNIPTGRAGCSAAVLDGEVIIIGGESGSQSSAHKQTQALNPVTGTWRTLGDLVTGRHGSQAIVNHEGIYIAAGSGRRGGSPELNSMESFFFGAPTTPSGTSLIAGLPAAIPPAIPDTEPGDLTDFFVSVDHSYGNQTILIHDLILSGNPAFSLLSGFSYPLALIPGKSLNLNLQFSPGDTGTYVAELRVVYGALLDTLVIPLQANALEACNAEVAPTGLSNTVESSAVVFSWNPVPQAVKCELNGRKSGTSSFSKVRFNMPAESIALPLSYFLTGTSYEWKIRCACSLSPLSVTPFSELAYFTIPELRKTEDISADWTLLPNPAAGDVLIQGVETKGTWTASLMDATGRQLQSWTFTGSSPSIRRGQFAPGHYRVQITSAEKTFSLPLIWQ